MPVKYHENAKTIKGVEVAVKQTGDISVEFTSAASLKATFREKAKRKSEVTQTSKTKKKWRISP